MISNICLQFLMILLAGTALPGLSSLNNSVALGAPHSAPALGKPLVVLDEPTSGAAKRRMTRTGKEPKRRTLKSNKSKGKKSDAPKGMNKCVFPTIAIKSDKSNKSKGRKSDAPSRMPSSLGMKANTSDAPSRMPSYKGMNDDNYDDKSNVPSPC
eukprot:CAMPEP_0197240228 /NCGR_PEP_ID=MMETSP1429-20130617/6561_1 /TAXON_ID=49237 /ORGANISM="Chaetoceros  sp., Strain UNC1202" /LENGTH=154 /DNA_ID=CAMNT_0042699825 /DNA_START=335 /DNA_END=799 /DNA_ORIENTATION=+